MAQRLGGDGRRVPATAPGHPRPTPARSAATSDLWDSREWREGLDAAPAPRPAARRHRRVHKRNRLAIVVTLLAVAVAGGVVLGRMAWERVGGTLDASADGAGNNLSEPSKPSVVTATAGAAELGPVRGAGTFTYASGTGLVRGSAGPLKRYKVAVENGSGQDVAAFAGAADAAVGDPRGWTGGGQLRLQRVGGSAAADFTVFLATPATSEAMCGTGGLHTDQYTSCRLPGKLVINLARWLGGVPDYGAPVSVYQQYAINHELGHELGLGHEACPGPGKPAPVMMQQTLGLKGCKANAWPFVDGQRYSGPKVP
jgi:hypothetical protein